MTGGYEVLVFAGAAIVEEQVARRHLMIQLPPAAKTLQSPMPSTEGNGEQIASTPDQRLELFLAPEAWSAWLPLLRHQLAERA